MVNNDNFLLKEIPKFHPLIQRFERLNFWKDIKRKTFEGEWVGGRWCPPELYYHVNLSTIQFLGGGRKVQGIGQPWFRDIEWEKAFIYSEACGFSGFIDDPVYTCLRNVLTETKDEIYRDFCLDNKGEKIDKNYRAIFTSAGELKKYMNAREYFWRTDMSNSFGKALYLNNAKNVIDFEGRGGGKDLEENTLIHGLSSSYPIKDARVGDKIYGADGKLTTITSKEIYDNQLQYEVKFSDGRTIECGGGHLWGVWHRSHSMWRYEVKSLDNIIIDYKRKRDGEYKYFIPISSPVEYSKKELPLDPYYLGLWLGDGNSHNTGVTTKDTEIKEYLYKFAEDNGLHIKENQNKSKTCPTYNINSTIGEIHKSGNPILKEELFGPLGMVMITKNDQEALKIANDIPFGLGNAVWTKDKKRQQFFIENLQSGTVSINKETSSDPRLPFGGVKRSGYGTELSMIALKEFVTAKTVVGN